jgi:glycosyltransferase involved in cell wall biosynthesis
MKICWFGIYTRDYPRNKILLSGLLLNGVEIVECNIDWQKKYRYFHLWRKLRSLKSDYDLIYSAYPATIPTILAKIVSRKPLVMDAFYSMFDSVVCDRREIKWYHPRALKLLFLDWLSVFLADYVITDTEAHKKYWSEWPLIGSKKIYPIYIGADDQIFFINKSNNTDNKYFWVSFHGLFIPLQGLEKIVESARILKNDDSVKFRIIGAGAQSKNIKKLIESYDLKNIEQIDRKILPNQVNEYLNKADVVLGIFGDTSKAYRVIPNKVYEGMAVKKPVITMDSSAIREIFSENELCLIKNDGQSLARAIKTLQANPVLMQRLATNGYNKFMKYYTPLPLGADLIKIFGKIIKNKS